MERCIGSGNPLLFACGAKGKTPDIPTSSRRNLTAEVIKRVDAAPKTAPKK